jgi:hypothetical protein
MGRPYAEQDTFLNLLRIIEEDERSFAEGCNQFSAERRNVLYHTPPHHIPFAESCLIDPDTTCVRNIILDTL